MRHTLSVLMENTPGVLTRVAGLFSRRGFNIDSLTVGRAEKPGFSRMTIVVEGDNAVLEQVSKQLYKLIEVLKVTDITSEQFVDRELVLIKVGLEQPVQRGEILQIADIFRARIVDLSKKSITLECTGDENKINAFEESIQPYGIKELMRTGKVAMLRH